MCNWRLRWVTGGAAPQSGGANGERALVTSSCWPGQRKPRWPLLAFVCSEVDTALACYSSVCFAVKRPGCCGGTSTVAVPIVHTWLTCNPNPPNSGDNRLLCRGSVCVRGQGGDRLPLCASPMKFSSGANQGVWGERVGGVCESVHRFKSAPARAAEFISNLLTPLALQIETSSGARRGVRRARGDGDDLRAADAWIRQEVRTSGD